MKLLKDYNVSSRVKSLELCTHCGSTQFKRLVKKLCSHQKNTIITLISMFGLIKLSLIYEKKMCPSYVQVVSE